MKRLTKKEYGTIYADSVEGRMWLKKAIDRLREFSEAEKEGISPCTFCRFNPPSSSDGKPCCMCPAEATLRREQDD